MSELRTDFKDEILQEGETHRVYNIKRKGTNEVVESGVYLEKAYKPLQEGDEYGAKDINELNGIVNVLTQDNLLINSDFRSGIINQKGETSYSYSGTGGKLTVDMWISYGVNVGIEMNTIRVINRDTTEHTLRQKMSKAYPNQVYTVAIQVGSVIGDVYINFNNETATNKKLKVGLNVFQITPVSTFGEFCFLLKANAEIKFNYAKVEKGSFFTGMPVWDEAIELLKCYQNQYALGLGWGNQYPVRSDSAVFRIFIQTPVRMRKNPSLIDLGGNTSVIVTGSQSSIVQQIPASSVQAIGISDNGVYIDFPIGSFKQIGYGQAVFSGRMILDSNDY